MAMMGCPWGPNLERITDTNGYSFRNAGIGLLVDFNTVFTNLTNRRNDFKIMYKIGIWKKEMYWMVMKEGLCQGGMATGVAVIVQAILSVSIQKSFLRIFVATDAGMMTACVVNVYISRLRTKIEDDPHNPRYIITVWGIGYKAGNL